jgi:hydroxymethylpyrimidine/phosphomethylpyrimidine kinase
VAGSDSGGGAGIQADLKVFTAMGIYGMSAVTAVTSQNTTGVRRIDPLPPEAVAAQMEACLEDIGCDAAKTGMLQGPAIVQAVAEVFRTFRVRNLVIDPVMVAKSGDVLLEPAARTALRESLLPLAAVVTPNLAEAGELAGIPVRKYADMREAARRIAGLGPPLVVVKGGHLDGDPADLVYDGREFHVLAMARIRTRNTHGTGCSFSAAITAGLARGLGGLEAVRAAKEAVTWGIANAPGLGKGYGPTNHMYFLREGVLPGNLQGGKRECTQPESI